MHGTPLVTTMRSLNGVPASVFCAVACLVLFFPAGLAAQGGEMPSVVALSEALHSDQRAHLWRVGAWGAANMAGGLALIALSDSETEVVRRAFGIQSAAWGAVNVGIATFGLLNGPDAAETVWRAAFGAENTYADILLVNLGLNVGYAAVGTTMLVAGSRDVRSADLWRGHGAALILQGAGLFFLDGLAFLGSRFRLHELARMSQDVEVAIGAGTVRLVVGL